MSRQFPTYFVTLTPGASKHPRLAREFKLQESMVLAGPAVSTGSTTNMLAGTVVECAKAWRRYARKAAIGSLELDLVPLEEHHRCQMEQFQDRLDAETVYLRHGSYFSAAIRKSPVWLERQWNREGQDGFSQGAFLNGRLIGIGSIYKLDGGRSAEAALVVACEFQGLGRGGEKGVGGLLLEDLIRYARDQQLERVTAYLAARNPRCERLLRKYGLEVSVWSYPKQEGSAVFDLSRYSSPDGAHANFFGFVRDLLFGAPAPG